MIVSIDRALKELINIKCSHKSGALIQKDWCLLEEEEMSDLSPCLLYTSDAADDWLVV